MWIGVDRSQVNAEWLSGLVACGDELDMSLGGA